MARGRGPGRAVRAPRRRAGGGVGRSGRPQGALLVGLRPAHLAVDRRRRRPHQAARAGLAGGGEQAVGGDDVVAHRGRHACPEARAHPRAARQVHHRRPAGEEGLQRVLGEVDLDQVEPRLVAEGLEVRLLLVPVVGVGEGVGAAHPPPVGHQRLAQRGADEPRAAGDDRARARPPGRRVRPGHGGRGGVGGPLARVGHAAHGQRRREPGPVEQPGSVRDVQVVGQRVAASPGRAGWTCSAGPRPRSPRRRAPRPAARRR